MSATRIPKSSLRKHTQIPLASSSMSPYIKVPAEVWKAICHRIRVVDDTTHGMARINTEERPPDGPLPQRLSTIVNQNLINISTTCKYIRSVSMPVLFETLHFFIPADAMDSFEMEDRALDCIRFMRQNPEIRAVVQEFSFYVGNEVPNDDGSRNIQSLMRAFVLLLPRLPKLVAIRIQGASLTSTFLHTILSLGPRLKHLSILNCRWPTYTKGDRMEDDDDTSSRTRLQLQSLRIQPTMWIHKWLSDFLCSSLEDIHAEYCFPGSQVQVLPKLRKLRVHDVPPAETSIFIQTLTGSRHLEEIWIGKPLWAEQMPKEALPQLRSVGGDVLNCYLIQNRPVEHAYFHYPIQEPWSRDPEPRIDPRRVVEILRSGSAALKRLKITTGPSETSRWSADLFKSVVTSLPYLEDLELDVAPEAMDKCYAPIAGLKALRSLSFQLVNTRENMSRNRQGRFVRELQKAITNRPAGKTLNVVSFVKDLEWRKDESGKWILYNEF